MEAMTQTGNPTSDEDLVANEYLTFTLGCEEYAIDILKVQEIRGYEQPTLIANAPPFIKGVINLRGTIVPIVDMRIKFNLGKISTRHSPSSSSSTSPGESSVPWSTAYPMSFR